MWRQGTKPACFVLLVCVHQLDLSRVFPVGVLSVPKVTTGKGWEANSRCFLNILSAYGPQLLKVCTFPFFCSCGLLCFSHDLYLLCCSLPLCGMFLMWVKTLWMFREMIFFLVVTGLRIRTLNNKLTWIRWRFIQLTYQHVKLLISTIKIGAFPYYSAAINPVSESPSALPNNEIIVPPN